MIQIYLGLIKMKAHHEHQKKNFILLRIKFFSSDTNIRNANMSESVHFAVSRQKEASQGHKPFSSEVGR